MSRYIDADALIDDLLDLAEANKGTYHEEGFKNAITVVEMQPTADVVERKDLDEILEAHERIGFEQGYRDGYAQAIEDAIKAVGLNTWAGSRISQLQTAQMDERRDG